ncbi:PREDICTED: tRNA pseudouridine synthase A isoform X2 [Trachymyrmex cornetzi]|uniref:tRNA pseudouridine synthase A isoform X2 n=1 Tax=Trachymyrmex cornetzi TaxID=471704 RepID=UPI00084F1979|nr:PREDICTED: tRNA pseudouridine synthase A isoform X2 [Trachymyrmex cornetzi]
MVRYFLKFSYIGTQYRGLQRQSSNSFVRDTDSIQGALETALRTVIPKSLIVPSLCLSSRTDAGVHALGNTAHVELENKYNIIYNSSDVKKYVNRYFSKCGHTIRLLDCIPVTQNFHVRFACKSRTYLYRFMIPKICGEQRISLPETIHTYHIRSYNFDIDRARRGIQLFMGTKDFTTFSAKAITDRKIHYVRALQAFTLEEAQPLMPFDPLSKHFTYFHFTCKARSFLYNQVRRMIGALIALGLGKITEKDITVMLQVPSHHNWNPCITPVPPNGLHLLNVEYDLDELRHCTILLEEEQEETPQLEELQWEEQGVQLKE